MNNGFSGRLAGWKCYSVTLKNKNMKTKVRCDRKINQLLIRTARLVLRRFKLTDASEIQRLAGDSSVASMMLNMPNPYENGAVTRWIINQKEDLKLGLAVNFAIVHRNNNCLMGAIGLAIHKDFERAMLTYWLGKPYWGCGYCTEAAQAVLRYGFEDLELNRIYGHHFKRNPASGRVMQKIGMSYEGCQRQHVKKWGAFQDVETYGILREDYEKLKRKYWEI